VGLRLQVKSSVEFKEEKKNNAEIAEYAEYAETYQPRHAN
jgi:hypothetical protein